MLVTYTKVNGKVFSIYLDNILNLKPLLLDTNIQVLSCYYITLREKTVLINLISSSHFYQILEDQRVVKIYKK
jgi:hypothetical protein